MIEQWGGQVKDNSTVYFFLSFSIKGTVLITRVADMSSDTYNSSSSVQPLDGETGNTIKTGFKPHYGAGVNSGSWLAFGY